MTAAGPSLLSVRQQVSASIRAAIYDGELEPGARLTERQICERVGVSRTIAREVIRELEAERLIESNRRHGFVVAAMSLKEIGDLYDIRVLLEAEACMLCARAMTDAVARRLDGALEAIERAAASGDREAQRTSNTEFYEVIFEAAGNVVLAQILHSLHGRVSYLRSRSMSQPGRPQASRGELGAILAGAQGRRRRGCGPPEHGAYQGSARRCRFRRSAKTGPTTTTEVREGTEDMTISGDRSERVRRAQHRRASAAPGRGRSSHSPIAHCRRSQPMPSPNCPDGSPASSPISATRRASAASSANMA